MPFGISRSRPDLYHDGRESCRYIDAMIGSRGRMLVVSPYIDAYYAKRLAARAPRGKTYVITSSADAQALKILGKGGSRLWIAAYTLLSTLLMYAFVLLGIGGYYLLIVAVPLIIGTAKHWRVRSAISLRVPRAFVHAKMYIAQCAAATGSANLTYSGMHRNIEHLSVTYSHEEIRRLEKQFWRLWDTARSP